MFVRKLFKIFCIVFIAALFLPKQSFALSAKAQTDKVSIEVLSASSTLQRNAPLDVLVRVTPQKGWHIYWDNPGDVGLPTQISWKLPPNLQIQALGHSAPQKYDADGLVLYGYGQSAYWKYRLTSSDKEHLPSPQVLEAKVSWLACKEECVPETVRVALPMHEQDEAGDSHPQQYWQDEALRAENTFPLKWKGKSFFDVSEDKLILRLESQHKGLFYQAENVWFSPNQRDKIDNVAVPKLGQDDEGNYSLEIPLLDSSVQNSDGVLLIEKAHHRRAYALSPMYQPGVQSLPLVEKYGEESLGWILLMAFVGGIVLNFMPCIFPILSIKAIALVQGAYNKRRARIEAIFYVLGVVVCFVIMASLLIVLRMQGEHIGWGFQLQSPVFVACMIVVFFVIFLMLLDLINLKNPFANKVGRISFAKQKVNAFFTGLFAVLIASPCTAPFMGIAIGYTLSKPIYVYYPIFVALSLGYALPFALIAFFPRILSRILPKPGKWMSILKKIFAIPVLLTCFWLAWVLWHLLNVNQMEKSEVIWQDYNAQKITEAVQSGTPVFIDFTAKWCITCLANEQLALNTPEFAQLVKDKNIILYKADWTNRNEQIAKALAQYGRNSVPLYVYYDGKYQTFHILPQLLTPAIIQENIK